MNALTRPPARVEAVDDELPRVDVHEPVLADASATEHVELRDDVVLAVARQYLADPVGSGFDRATGRLLRQAIAPPTREIVEERPAWIRDLWLRRDPPTARRGVARSPVERSSDRDPSLRVAVLVSSGFLRDRLSGVDLDPIVGVRRPCAQGFAHAMRLPPRRWPRPQAL